MLQSIHDVCRARPVATMMAVFGSILMGLISLFRIPLSYMPATRYPGLTVEITYPGVTPDKIEEIITQPVEEVISTVGGIEDMTSTSEEGKAKIFLQFEHSSDLDLRALEIRERVDLVASTFPKETQKPVILKYDPEQRPFLVISLDSGVYSLEELRRIAERDYKKNLRSINGISEVFVAGGRDREVAVETDRPRLQAHGLSIGDLMKALQQSNTNISAGQIQTTARTISVYLKGRFASVEQIHDLLIQADQSGKIIRLADVADIHYVWKDQETAARVNGQDRVSVYVYRSSGADIVSAAGEARRYFESLDSAYVQYQITQDQAEDIKSAFYGILALWMVGLFLFGTWLVYRARRAGNLILTFLNLIVALLSTLFALYVMRQSFNVIVLSAFYMYTPLIFYFSYRAESSSRTSETIKLVCLLLLAGTFMPILFASSQSRILFSGLGLAAILSTGFSLLWGPAIVGALGNRLPEWEFQPHPLRSMRILRLHQKRLRKRIHQLAPAIRTRIAPLSGRIPERARVFLAEHHFLIFIVVATAGLGLSLRFVKMDMTGELQNNRFNVQIEFPSGTSFQATNATAQKVEKAMLEMEGIDQVTSKVDAAQASLIVKLKSGYDVSQKSLDSYRDRLKGYEPAFVYFSSDNQSGSLQELTIDVMGKDLALVDEIVKKLMKQAELFPNVRDIVLRYKAPRPELQVTIDKEKAERAGLTTQDVGQMLRYALQGGITTKFVEGNRELDVRVRYQEEFRKDPDSIKQIYIKSPDKNFIPLSEISRMEEKPVPVKIFRKNKKRTFSFSYRPSSLDPSTVDSHLSSFRHNPLPENYRIDAGRELRDLIATRRQFTAMIALAAVIIYMILASYSESLIRPLSALFALIPPIACAIILLSILRIPVTIPVFASLLQLSVIILSRVLSDEEKTPREEMAISGGTVLFILPAIFLPGLGHQILIGACLAYASGLVCSWVSIPYTRRGASEIWIARSAYAEKIILFIVPLRGRVLEVWAKARVLAEALFYKFRRMMRR